jgi:hypothetical protein
MITGRGNRSDGRKPSHTVTLSITNSRWTDVGLNPRLCSKKPTTNGPNCHTIYSLIKKRNSWERAAAYKHRNSQILQFNPRFRTGAPRFKRPLGVTVSLTDSQTLSTPASTLEWGSKPCINYELTAENYLQVAPCIANCHVLKFALHQEIHNLWMLMCYQLIYYRVHKSPPLVPNPELD